MEIRKFLLFTIAGVLIAMNDYAANLLGGKTIRETFPAESVANFVTAVTEGNYAEADRLVRAGTNVNATGEEGISPLLWIMAATLDTRKIEYLLKVGANPNYRDSTTGASAMFIAAGGERLDILEILLKNKGDPNFLGPRDETLLMIAAGQFREKNIEMLLKYGADVNRHDPHEATVAIKAAHYGRFDWVASFLSQGLTYNLQGLAKSVEIRQVPPDSEQQRWKDKVIEMLKAKGVKFPTFVPCYPPDDPRRKEENCTRFKSRPPSM
jgi:hypothetical protein